MTDTEASGAQKHAPTPIRMLAEFDVAPDELNRLYESPISTSPANYGEAHHNINPDCPICLKPVFWSRHLFSVDRAWHVQCFTCSYCRKPLKPGEQSFRGGKMFCTDPCYNELFSGVCNTYDCHQPPQEAADANTGDAANDRCLSCKRLMGVRNESGQFPDGKFPGYLAAKQKHLMWAPDDSGQSQGIICGPHLVHNFIGEECVRCSQPVYAAESCYSMNLPWHLRCLRCALCDRVLQPAQHAVHRGLPLCTHPCYSRLFSMHGYRRGWQEWRS